MLDDKGNIIHIGKEKCIMYCCFLSQNYNIDFGFILDIAPGGIRFESSPFKLTKEMIKLMGDSSDSSYFTYFKELCVLAFLALRPYTDKIVALASLLFESNLPCFKNGTICLIKRAILISLIDRRNVNK